MPRLASALRGSVRVRITSAAAAVVGVALLLGAIALVASLHAVLTREVRVTTTVRATEMARMVESGGPGAATVAGDEVTLQVLGPAGDVLAASPNAAGLPALVQLKPGESRAIEVPFDDSTYLAVAAAAGPCRTVVLGQSLDQVEEPTRALVVLLAVGLPALLVVVAVTTWRLVGRALAPVDAIRGQVDAISAAALHRRVPQPSTRDEIARLAATMNRMLERLESAQIRERRFIADASHELRSPIAAIRQHAEVALAHPDLGDGLAHVAHAESLRMQALVDDLLLLAQADEHGPNLRRQPVDVDDLVLAEARRLRDADELRVDASGVSAARVDGDPAALRRMLRNLVDNAVRHASHQIAFSLSEQDGWAVLHVDDDGPGVPAGDRTRVFERFVRLDDARVGIDGGTGGLGLAIVTEIVVAHGGNVVIEEAPLGGARAAVRLPLHPGLAPGPAPGLPPGLAPGPAPGLAPGLPPG
ncbi:MAG TPA: HAMP domain-containing sensor histidine kinase [Actinoplanes sp.]|nr:HAMP domain-containing sensor histidine kinase [Actinoplanes sp.]